MASISWGAGDFPGEDMTVLRKSQLGSFTSPSWGSTSFWTGYSTQLLQSKRVNQIVCHRESFPVTFSDKYWALNSNLYHFYFFLDSTSTFNRNVKFQWCTVRSVKLLNISNLYLEKREILPTIPSRKSLKISLSISRISLNIREILLKIAIFSLN